MFKLIVDAGICFFFRVDIRHKEVQHEVAEYTQAQKSVEKADGHVEGQVGSQEVVHSSCGTLDESEGAEASFCTFGVEVTKGGVQDSEKASITQAEQHGRKKELSAGARGNHIHDREAEGTSENKEGRQK